MADLFAAEQVEASGAVFSPCRRYRYLLWRTWDRTLPHATFCMMNGSTADELKNDPTVKRCVVRVGKWAEMGFMDIGGVKVVNAFGWRETDSTKLPKLIAEGIDILGPENDRHILEACVGAAIVVCGWGLPGHQLLGRGPKLLALLRRASVTPYALRINDDGSPGHPLYIGYNVLPRLLP